MSTEGRSLCAVADPPCREVLRDTASGVGGFGTDVTVSTEPPLVPSVYPAVAMSCPHGVVYYVTPTGEQIAAWVRDGVA